MVPAVPTAGLSLSPDGAGMMLVSVQVPDSVPGWRHPVNVTAFASSAFTFVFDLTVVSCACTDSASEQATASEQSTRFLIMVFCLLTEPQLARPDGVAQ